MNDDRVLWRVPASGPGGPGGVVLECVMVSCCAGAELQIRRNDDVVLRELYPMKSDLYERARALEAEYRGAALRSSAG
jgi:hypothetical protein